MIRVQVASASDAGRLSELLLQAPVEAGTKFVLDRSPDFSALLRLRGQFRTFMVVDGGRLAGMATALWHDVPEGPGWVRVGEIVDLRVARSCRGGRAVSRLLEAVRTTFEEQSVDSVVCLIGDRNLAARTLVTGKAGFPLLEPLTRWASIHFVAWRAPLKGSRSLRIREASGADSAVLEGLLEEAAAERRFVPRPLLALPREAGEQRAWIAESMGATVGALVVWDGEALRRLRVIRYRPADAALRLTVGLAALVRLAPALPAPGGVMRMWASRWLAMRNGRTDAVRGLVRAALRAAAREGVNLLQVNVAEGDPVLTALPTLPRATYWSTLYGCGLRSPLRVPAPTPRPLPFHADIAFV
jgi:hypothetical protein